MKIKIEPIWVRLLKRLLPATSPVQRPIAEDANTELLGRLDENDPTLKCVLDHAFAQFSNDMAVVLDMEKDDATRLRHANSAAGIQKFIEDIEMRRAGWNEERKRRLEREKQTGKKQP